MGSLASATCDAKCGPGNLPRGTRYAVFIQKLDSGVDIALTDTCCLTQYVPVQPGTMSRAGKPFHCGRGRPFISKAMSVFASIATSTGSDLTKSGVFSSA